MRWLRHTSLHTHTCAVELFQSHLLGLMHTHARIVPDGLQVKIAPFSLGDECFNQASGFGGDLSGRDPQTKAGLQRSGIA